MYLGRVWQPFKYVALSEIHSPSGKLWMGRWTWLPRYCWVVLLYKMMVDSCLHIDKLSHWIFVTKYQSLLNIGLPYHQWLCGCRLSCNQRQCIVRLLATPNTCEYLRILVSTCKYLWILPNTCASTACVAVSAGIGHLDRAPTESAIHFNFWIQAAGWGTEPHCLKPRSNWFQYF